MWYKVHKIYRMTQKSINTYFHCGPKRGENHKTNIAKGIKEKKNKTSKFV